MGGGGYKRGEQSNVSSQLYRVHMSSHRMRFEFLIYFYDARILLLIYQPVAPPPTEPLTVV